MATLGDFRPTFGGFWSTLRRFLQAGSTFCGLFSQISFVGFLVPFLGSIFDPFLDFSWTRICLFYGVSCPSKVVFGPFLDVFLTVHFIMIFCLPREGVMGHCCPLVAYGMASSSGSYLRWRGWFMTSCWSTTRTRACMGLSRLLFSIFHVACFSVCDKLV